MKQLTAIAFCLLLIVAQTFAVTAPVSSKPVFAKPGCCGDDCCCAVQQPSTPSVPFTESTAPVSTQSQLVFPPVAVLAFLLAAPASQSASLPAAAELHAAAPPLFRRNCSLLI